MKQKRIAFDIETIGEDFDKMDETSQELLTKWIKTEARSEEAYEADVRAIKDNLGFSPLTGEIVAIGVLDIDTNEGGVYYQNLDDPTHDTHEEGIHFKAMDEKGILDYFWKIAGACTKIVSYNGRGFDVPFIDARSMKHGIKPSVNLMPPRFTESLHVDLMDKLSYYGTVRKKGSLHFWCRMLGIPSPKANGVSGDDVGKLFHDKEYFKIAKYNVDDIRATAELFKRWDECLNFNKRDY